MTPPTGGAVRVEADLTVDVDGRAVTVTGAGDRVRIEVSDPAHVVRALASASLPATSTGPLTRSSLVLAADGLARAGLTVTVVGPRGRLVTLGAGAGAGPWTRRATGSDHASFGSWSALVPVLRPVLTSAVRGAVRGAAARTTRG